MAPVPDQPGFFEHIVDFIVCNQAILPYTCINLQDTNYWTHNLKPHDEQFILHNMIKDLGRGLKIQSLK